MQLLKERSIYLWNNKEQPGKQSSNRWKKNIETSYELCVPAGNELSVGFLPFMTILILIVNNMIIVTQMAVLKEDFLSKSASVWEPAKYLH